MFEMPGIVGKAPELIRAALRTGATLKQPWRQYIGLLRLVLITLASAERRPLLDRTGERLQRLRTYPRDPTTTLS